MTLSERAVRRPVLTAMVFLAIMILGGVSFTRLQVDLLPEIDFPSISVVTVYDGAGPEEIETIITRPMEQSLATVEGIDRIESFSTEGRSRVALRFVWGTNLDTAMNDVRAVVERIKSSLPEDVDNPVVYKFNLGAFPILYAGLSGELDEPALRQLAEQSLIPRLERIEGIAAVEVRGGLKREIHVRLDQDRLRALNISPLDVVQALRDGNRNVPAGQIRMHDANVLVRTIGESGSIEDFQSIVVKARRELDGRRTPILLSEVATILDTFEEPSNMVYINGQPGIRLNVSKQSGSNTVEVAQRARAEFDKINRDYAGRANLQVITDTSEYIEDSISNVQNSVLAGALLAVFVLLFFLRNVRSTLIVATGIPVSIIGIFTLMYYFDVTLNLISFGGVALGIGMLVDNAIVILENIFRKYEEGLDPTTAAIEGAREVGGAIVASTTTTLVVFLPVIFLTGLASIFFGQMAFVVSFALICSLFVALTLIPVLSSRFLKAGAQPREDSVVGRTLAVIDGGYGRFVDTCLRHPFITMLVALAILGGSLALVPLLGTELMPEGDQSEVNVNIELPVGTRIEVTDAAVRQIESLIGEHVPEATTMQTVVGTPGFWSTSGGESARTTVNVVKPTQRDRTSEEIANDLRPHVEGIIAGADVRVQAGGGLWILRMLRGGGERLEVQVRGYDVPTSQRLASEVQAIMDGTDGVSGARMSRQDGAREMQVVPDRDKIAALGLSYDIVARQIQTMLQGTRATVLRERGDEFNVIVKLPEEQTVGIESLLDLPIVIGDIGSTPLRNVAAIDETVGPLTIERLNQARVVKVTANLTGARDLGSIADELRERIQAIDDVPDDFSIIVTGEEEEQKKTFEGLLIGIILAMLLVYMVMAAQFESFLHPFLIMFSIPFAAVGAIVALLITDTTFNIQSFMGAVVLIGIVVNNAIVLIDYINLLRREHGMGVTDAVALAARRRLRPILMTTTTTMLALLPVAIGFAEGGEMQAPLARVVIGGMFTSSAISLVIIPVLYNTVESWRARREEPEEPQMS